MRKRRPTSRQRPVWTESSNAKLIAPPGCASARKSARPRCETALPHLPLPRLLLILRLPRINHVALAVLVPTAPALATSLHKQPLPVVQTLQLLARLRLPAPRPSQLPPRSRRPLRALFLRPPSRPHRGQVLSPPRRQPADLPPLQALTVLRQHLHRVQTVATKRRVSVRLTRTTTSTSLTIRRRRTPASSRSLIPLTARAQRSGSRLTSARRRGYRLSPPSCRAGCL